MTVLTAQWISFVLGMIALTGVLVWGLKKISRVADKDMGDGTTVLQQMISEDKKPKQGGNNPDIGEDKQSTSTESGKGSFSRLAGAIGAMVISATFAGIGYWIVYTLFFKPEQLDKFKELGVYFLAGSAMFMPYAFNKLSDIFKSS